MLFIATFIVGQFSNADNADMSAPMAKAGLPVVALKSGGRDINPLMGYISKMDLSYFRGSIIPVDSSREVSYKVYTYGSPVRDLAFEVRSIDGKSLVENTSLTDYTFEDGVINGSFQIKDLITAYREYMLVILMDTELGRARYYTRLIWTEDDSRYHMEDELSFALAFSEATFNKEAAKEYSKYLEPNSEGDNTTFNRVNIHSNLNQVTWGDLEITGRTDPDIYVTDLQAQTGSYVLKYRVKVKDGINEREYNVKEEYRIRHTSDRLYLLDFVRTMNFIFDTYSYILGTDTIGLSISSPDIQLVESGGGSAFAFVSENRLYMFNNSESKLASIFGFYDSDNDDERTRWDQHSVKILNVDEAGNVLFSVAGYMNRGNHEGCVGVAVYDYNCSINAVEELAFIESNQSPEILCNYMSKIAFLSNGGVFYCMLDQNIYAVDLATRTCGLVVDNIGAGEYKISSSESTIAWQKDLKGLSLMNLNYRTESLKEAEEGELLILLGFMGEDLVYGICNNSDVGVDRIGNPIYPMNRIIIEDLEGNVLENYHPEGIFVSGVNIGTNQIRLTRLVKSTDNNYVSTYDDQIVSTLKEEGGSNTLEVVAVDVFEKIVQIHLKNDLKSGKFRVLTPNQTLFEGSRNVTPDIERDVDEKPFYYAYGLGGIEGIFTNAADAVSLANSVSGVVTGDGNDYVWIKGNLSRSNQIMAITRDAENYDNMTSRNSTAVCLDLILNFEGISRNVEELLAEGMGVVDILSSSLPDSRILDLDGCPLSTILYYVNQDIPVMVMLNNGQSMLVIGFNDLNTVLMNPQSGEVYKYGMNDTDKLFSENGNHFVTYIDKERGYR
ncbi:MAG: hypothetical protein K6E91_12025 [Butyrivibrio sp.]|nr:hypothetical protein [Butyrivibrio sp.]